MAQDDRQWFQQDGFQSEAAEETTAEGEPSGRFSGDDIEFESFMFDPGESRTGTGTGPFAGLAGAPEPVAVAVATQVEPPLSVAPVAGRFPTSPFSPGTNGSRPSGPLHATGPFVDGRLTTPVIQASDEPFEAPVPPAASAEPVPEPSVGHPATGPLSQRLLANTGPLAGRTTGPISSGSGVDATVGVLRSRFTATGPLKPIEPEAEIPVEELAATKPVEQAMAGAEVPFVVEQVAPAEPEAEPQPEPAPIPVVAAAPPVSGPLEGRLTTGSLATATGPLLRRPIPEPDMWSDTSLSLVEDFSTLLIARDSIKRRSTTGGLHAGYLLFSPVATAPGLAVPTAVAVAEETPPPPAAVAAVGEPPKPVSAPLLAEAVEPPTVAPVEQVEPVGAEPVEPAKAFSGAPLEGFPFPLEQTAESEFEPFVVPQIVETPELTQFEPDVVSFEALPADDLPLDTSAGPAPALETISQQGDLPFWLRNTGDLLASPAAGYLQALDAAPQPVETPPAEPPLQALPPTEPVGELAPAPTAEALPHEMPAAEEFDYADLPPIEPFDFTAIELSRQEKEEESLGFRTDELIGFDARDEDGSHATTDLQAVADLLEPRRPARTGPAEVPQETPPVPQPSPEIPGESFSAPAPTATHGWTGFVTGALLQDSGAPEEAAGQLDVAEAGVSPFDYTALDLETDEVATGYLEAVRTRITGPLGARPHTTGPLTERIVDEPSEETGEEWEGALWNTGPLGSTPANGRGWPTIWLSDEEDVESRTPSEPLPATEPLMDILAEPTGPVRMVETGPMGTYVSPGDEEAEPVLPGTAPESGVAPAEMAAEAASFEDVELDEGLATGWLEVGTAGEEAPEPAAWSFEPYVPDISGLVEPSEPAPELEVAYSPNGVEGHEPALGVAEAQYVVEPVPLQPDEPTAKEIPTAEVAPVVEALAEPEPAAPIVEQAPLPAPAKPPRKPRAPSKRKQAPVAPAIIEAAVQPQASAAPVQKRGRKPKEKLAAAARVESPAPQPAPAPEPLPTPAPPAIEPPAYEPAAARVAGADWLEGSSQYAAPPAQAARVSYPEPQASWQTPSPSRAHSFATTLLASGPLPDLAGFEDLQALVARNPADIGAAMALAAAYQQVGDVDTALRVYRRILRRPEVPSAFLRLIAEDLTEFEPEFAGQVHFHQVRGDLYMKQGRFSEAVAEYNKIGQ